MGSDPYRYRAMIGVGGIGSGSFFALSGNETLGREESRGGRFLDRRDYCKLHIISHYVSRLLGREFATLPVGKVGDDEVGRRLLNEMAAAGLDLRHVERSAADQTLFSFCFVYPDGSGGNMTTDDSACSHVNPAFVRRSEDDFRRYAGRGVALAAPEAPLEARAELLRLATAHGFFRVASFTSGEIPAVLRDGLMKQVDLLAINRDEAAAVSSAGVESAIAHLRSENPAMRLSVTAGKDGSWSWDGGALRHLPSLPVPVASTAGAGDAHLSGIIAGLVAGLTLADAQHLGTLVAAMSVTSPHTIHPGIERASLLAFAREYDAPLSGAIRTFLEEPA